MTDCDRVREVLRVNMRCCQRCHATGELTKLALNGQKMQVCCTLAGASLQRDPSHLPFDVSYGGEDEE